MESVDLVFHYMGIWVFSPNLAYVGGESEFLLSGEETEVQREVRRNTGSIFKKMLMTRGDGEPRGVDVFRPRRPIFSFSIETGVLHFRKSN
ncbi:hypothetical protein ACS0TY_030596 [Phlomoides rotata]